MQVNSITENNANTEKLYLIQRYVPRVYVYQTEQSNMYTPYVSDARFFTSDQADAMLAEGDTKVPLTKALVYEAYKQIKEQKADLATRRRECEQNYSEEMATCNEEGQRLYRNYNKLEKIAKELGVSPRGTYDSDEFSHYTNIEDLEKSIGGENIESLVSFYDRKDIIVLEDINYILSKHNMSAVFDSIEELDKAFVPESHKHDDTMFYIKAYTDLYPLHLENGKYLVLYNDEEKESAFISKKDLDDFAIEYRLNELEAEM